MASNGTSSGPLLYTVCALAAIGVLADVILLVWQLMTYKFERGFRFVKGSLILLNVFYALTGVAVILLLLYQDVAADFLCKAGGFLILFATQETVWMVATASVALLLWKRRCLSRDFQKRNVSIFVLIICAQSLILLTISFLPFTNIQYFDTVAEYYFRCAPLRIPGEQGWAFSTLVLILNWIAVGTTSVTLAVVSVRYSKCTEPEMAPAERLLQALPSKRRLQRQVFLSLCVAAAGWTVTQVLACVAYFSGERLDKGTMQWLLSFSISITINLHPLVFLVNALLAKWVYPRRRKDPTGLKALLDARPRSLETSQRQHAGPQDPGILSFMVRWREPSGCFQSGSLKVYTPAAQDKWRNEVNAIARVGALSHPNVAPYLWIATNNPFSAFLHSSTRITLSKRSLLVCRLQYPSGTLYSFLQNRVHQLTEIGLHKITLDVASGLEHIHQNNLVHNGLTTHTVYMASISEKIGLKAVIGDLEHCYEVPASSHRDGSKPLTKPWSPGSQLPDLFSITGRIEVGANLTNNRFAPDIRSFGVIVLEMLMALTEYNQKKRIRLKVSSRGTNESRHSLQSIQSFDTIPQRTAMTEIRGATTCSSSTEDDIELPVTSHQGQHALPSQDQQQHQHHQHQHHHQHHHHASGEPCTCSSSVTNVRAVCKASGGGSTAAAAAGASKRDRYSFQLNVLGSKQQSKASGVEAGKFAARQNESLDSIDEIVSDRPNCQYDGRVVVPKPIHAKQAMAGLDSRRKPWELGHRDTAAGPLPRSTAEVAIDVSQDSISPQSEYSPRSDITSDSSPDTLIHGKQAASEESVSIEVDASNALRSPEKSFEAVPNAQQKTPASMAPGASRTASDPPETPESDSERSLLAGALCMSPGRRGSHKQILTNGSFLTPRSTPEIRPPSRPRRTDACTDTADFGAYDSSESLRSAGLESLTEAAGDEEIHEAHQAAATAAEMLADAGGLAKQESEYSAGKQFYATHFQTIYEEEDGVGGNSSKEQLGDAQGRKLQKVPLARRRLPPVPGTSAEHSVSAFTSTTDAARKKRNSMVSLDESVVSADSGVGSSCHYDMSDQSSVYFHNLPGTREPLYMSEAGPSDGELYGPMRTFLGRRNHGNRPQDSGIESNTDSCDELSRYDCPQSDSAELNRKVRGKTDMKGNIQNTGPVENVYEIVPETTGKGHVIKRKKPCVGHHEGVGHSCCSVKTNIIREDPKRTSASSTKTKDRKPRDSSPKKAAAEVSVETQGNLTPSRQHTASKSNGGSAQANVEAQWRQLVDTATNTSDQDDSFHEEERKKAQQQTETGEVPERRPGALTTPIFTKLEVALLDELLDLRQQNSNNKGATQSNFGEGHYNLQHTYIPGQPGKLCAGHCSKCRRLYQRQCDGSGYLQPIPNRRKPPGFPSNSSSFKLSSSSSSSPGSALLHSSMSSADTGSVTSYPADGATPGPSRAGVGHRQMAQMQRLLPPCEQASYSNNQEMRNLLDGVQKQGNLGYIAGQLVPLLNDCWTDDPVPTADDILQKLCEVLPTAAV